MNRTLTIVQPTLVMTEPHNCSDIKDVLNVHTALFDPLVAYDDRMNFVPGLAASWEVSDDARTWTFALRPGATFHHGPPADAEAVVHSLKRMARPDMGVTLGAPGVYNQYLAGMELTIIDRHTVQIKLEAPMADLLDVLVTGYILPPDLVETAGNRFKEEPVGTGPYRFIENRSGTCLRAGKHLDYFGNLPLPDYIEWHMVPDPDQRLSMIRQGTADIAAGPPFTINPDSVESVQSRGTTAYILIFNVAREVMADPRVRTALNLGIDRTALIDRVLHGAGDPLNGFISPAHFGCDHRCSGFFHDPQRARKLLTDAGFGSGLQLTLDSPTSMPDEAIQLSESLAEQLSAIGVHLSICYTEDRERYANKVRLKEIHDMCVFDSSPLSTFRVLKEKIDSRFKGSWWQGYANPEVERLLDHAQTTVDTERRKTLYEQCYRILNEDPPWLYLYHYKIVTCTAPTLAGWAPPLHGVIDPRYL